MRVDQVEVSWDSQKSDWVIRMQSGDAKKFVGDIVRELSGGGGH